MPIEMVSATAIHRIEGYLTAYFSPYLPLDAEPKYNFQHYDSCGQDTILVQPVEFILEFTPPTRADYIKLRTEHLRAEIVKLRLAAEEAVAEVDDKLKRLLALEYSA